MAHRSLDPQGHRYVWPGQRWRCYICCHRDFRLTKVQHGGHMQSTETEGLEEKLDDGTPASAGFPGIERRDLLLCRDKPLFVDPQLLNFRVQRRAGNSEFRCRTFW